MIKGGKDIISDFAEGDERALRDIYEKFSPPMRLYARKYLKNNPEEIDDLVQDAFVALWEKRANFFTLDEAGAFLYHIIRNASLNRLRHLRVREKFAMRFPFEDTESSYLDHILEAELFRHVMLVFNKLTPTTRKVYRLSLEGKPHEEIATQLGITINTVKKHKNNANHFMREKFNKIFR